jgi:hypothetical protein
MCLSLEQYDVERLEQLCHFTSRSELVITWFNSPSPFLKLYYSSSQSLFSSRLIFLWWFTLKRYLCYTLYIVKVNKNSREFVWQIIIEGSAKENDVWVWMRPHIKFCTIGKCDILLFFLSIESFPIACKFHPLFFFSSFETWSFFI